jgi:hypothetical protein
MEYISNGEGPILSRCSPYFFIIPDSMIE